MKWLKIKKDVELKQLEQIGFEYNGFGEWGESFPHYKKDGLHFDTGYYGVYIVDCETKTLDLEVEFYMGKSGRIQFAKEINEFVKAGIIDIEKCCVDYFISLSYEVEIHEQTYTFRKGDEHDFVQFTIDFGKKQVPLKKERLYIDYPNAKCEELDFTGDESFVIVDLKYILECKED